MADESKKNTEKRGRPRWMNKRSRRRAHGGNKPRPEAEGAPAPPPKGAAPAAQKGRHQQGSGNKREQPALQMVNGCLKRRSRFTSMFNMQRELEKTYFEAKKEIQALKQIKEICILCDGEIQDILTAIPHREEEKRFCHFECVQKELAGQEQVSANESFVYIGNGDFCIVQERRNRNKPYYFFRKRIHYRDPEKIRK
jgi:hypothetical protein